jgi:hypothetical protein
MTLPQIWQNQYQEHRTQNPNVMQQRKEESWVCGCHLGVLGGGTRNQRRRRRRAEEEAPDEEEEEADPVRSKP